MLTLSWFETLKGLWNGEGSKSTLVPKLNQTFWWQQGDPMRALSKPKLGGRRGCTPHALLAAKVVTAQVRPSRLSVGFHHQSQSALSNNPTWANQSVCAPCWKGPRHRQPGPLGKAGRLDAELPWEQCGCVTPTPWHPRTQHTVFNHPLTCVSPYRVHLPEEALVWSARTYYTWRVSK